MPPAATPAQVLVVDDEPDLRTLYELTLLREGYDVETAGSVEELWPLLSPRLEPDAVILLKASRGVQLEQLVPHLTSWATK